MQDLHVLVLTRNDWLINNEWTSTHKTTTVSVWKEMLAVRNGEIKTGDKVSARNWRKKRKIRTKVMDRNWRKCNVTLAQTIEEEERRQWNSSHSGPTNRTIRCGSRSEDEKKENKFFPFLSEEEESKTVESSWTSVDETTFNDNPLILRPPNSPKRARPSRQPRKRNDEREREKERERERERKKNKKIKRKIQEPLPPLGPLFSGKLSPHHSFHWKVFLFEEKEKLTFWFCFRLCLPRSDDFFVLFCALTFHCPCCLSSLALEPRSLKTFQHQSLSAISIVCEKWRCLQTKKFHRQAFELSFKFSELIIVGWQGWRDLTDGWRIDEYQIHHFACESYLMNEE